MRLAVLGVSWSLSVGVGLPDGPGEEADGQSDGSGLD